MTMRDKIVTTTNCIIVDTHCSLLVGLWYASVANTTVVRCQCHASHTLDDYWRGRGEERQEPCIKVNLQSSTTTWRLSPEESPCTCRVHTHPSAPNYRNARPGCSDWIWARGTSVRVGPCLHQSRTIGRPTAWMQLLEVSLAPQASEYIIMAPAHPLRPPSTICFLLRPPLPSIQSSCGDVSHGEGLPDGKRGLPEGGRQG